jgi:hypothetical protein
MLKLGEKIISDIYLGDKKIAKVFLGDKLVYQANKPIFLDYIDSDGNNCIDSGIECTSDLKIEFKGSGSSQLNQACCGGIGLQNAPTYFRYHWTPGGNLLGFWCMYDSVSIANINCKYTMGESTEVTIDAPNGIAIVDGTKYTFTKLEKGLTTGKNFGVFGRISSKGDIQSKPSRFYYFKIYKNDILMRDLRPCIDPKGVVCMYDMVTKKYHYNIGTGTLKAGNKIKFVDYIYFDNSSTTQYNEVSACYVNTGIQNQDGIWAEVTWRTTEVGRWLFGMGQNSQSDNFMYGHFRVEGTAYIGCGNASNSIRNPNNINGADGQKHTAIIKYDKYIFDGFEKELTGNDNTYEYFYDIYLGTTNYLKRADGRGFIGEIYNFKLYNNTNELIQDLRPCVVAGEACFYDMVTGKIFTNAGTGTLKASGRFVESIVFDGNSWIDTGINKQSCTIECTVKLESTGYRQFLCGWSHIGGYYIAVDTSNRFELGSSAIATGSNATELSNIVAEHTETDMILTVNGNYTKRTKQVQTEPDKNYWLGNINSTSYSAPIKGQVRGHKFKNADGVLIQDLRPYVDENGTACFKDIVTGNLFYNKGTGTLGYTEE